MDHTTDFPIADCDVGLDAHAVLDLGVGRHLTATQRSNPLLSGHDERPTDPVPLHVGIDIPAFDVADWLRLRPFGIGPDRRLQEAAQPARGTLGDPDGDLAHAISA
jgi:hypothetical protein